MADCYSNYLRDKINDHLHGGSDFTRPATTYFALFTAMPTAAGGGTEVTGGSYARVAFTNNGSNWPASSGQLKANANAITWPAPTADWTIVLGYAEFDASSGGNMLTFALFATPREILNGDPAFEIPVGAGVFGWAA